MATIGLDSLYYADITEDSDGDETYGTPAILAKAMKADVSVAVNEATLYADDGAAEVVKEFKNGTITLGVNDIGVTVASALTGARVDSNGVLVSSAENGGKPVAVGYRARKSDGKYKYFWLYRVVFAIPNANLATKGDSIAFQTPTIVGTIMRRNKLDGAGEHPWKTEANQGDTNLPASVISGWFGSVYEPSFTAADLSALTVGELTLTPAFDADTTEYTATATNDSDVITATAGTGSEVVIKNGSTTVTSGSAATWATGANVVTIAVTNGTLTKTYKVTVTKS